MSKTIQSKSSLDSRLISSRRNFLISLLVLFHFMMISLTYATNWRRSSIQDQLLVALHPYLIGANLYQEMLPVELVTESFKPGSLRLKVEYSNRLGHWEYVLGLKEDSEAAKSDRLLHTLAELAAGEDSQGLTRVLKSIVMHLESRQTQKKVFVTKISIERTSDGIVEGLYDASTARFSDGDFGFVPTIEHNRSVKAIDAIRVTP